MKAQREWMLVLDKQCKKGEKKEQWRKGEQSERERGSGKGREESNKRER